MSNPGGNWPVLAGLPVGAGALIIVDWIEGMPAVGWPVLAGLPVGAGALIIVEGIEGMPAANPAWAF